MNKAYTFEKRKDTEEIHIFEGTYGLIKATYQPALVCICGGKIHKNSEKIRSEICLSESEARLIAARIGRAVCGTCMSSLYSSYSSK